MFILTVGPYYELDICGYSNDRAVLERHADESARCSIRESYKSRLYLDYKNRPENLYRIESVPITRLLVKTHEMTNTERQRINSQNRYIRSQNENALDPVRKAIDEEAKAYADSLVDTQKITQEMIDRVKIENDILIRVLKELV